MKSLGEEQLGDRKCEE